MFELLKGDSMNLEILFSPEEAREYKERLAIVCDNCQVKELIIKGNVGYNSRTYACSTI